jgi:hypothetical protein
MPAAVFRAHAVAFILKTYDGATIAYLLSGSEGIDVSYQPRGQARRVRECIHRERGLNGGFYPGDRFVAALHRLRDNAGLMMARKVQPFFWADAPLIDVWLCAECAREAGLSVETQQLDAA